MYMVNQNIFLFLFMLLVIILVWYFLIFLFLIIKFKSDFLSNKVVKVTSNYWAEAFQIFLAQLNWLYTMVILLYKTWKKHKENDDLMVRKSNVLSNVINHLNERLEEETNLKTVYPASTGGIDIWVYLSNDPSPQEKTNLENYFIGVLSKYTNEFALDRMSVEVISGAGWVAKFDVKTASEAQYNRMARASEVNVEDIYDEDDIAW